MSAAISIGNNTPVDAFSPKTNAKVITIMIPMPFIPDLEKPKTKAAKNTAIHCNTEKL